MKTVCYSDYTVCSKIFMSAVKNYKLVNHSYYDRFLNKKYLHFPIVDFVYSQYIFAFIYYSAVFIRKSFFSV